MFRFVMKLIGIQSLIVQDVLVHLKEQVEAVEELRRAGPDAKLRYEYLFLQEHFAHSNFKLILQEFTEEGRRIFASEKILMHNESYKIEILHDFR